MNCPTRVPLTAPITLRTPTSFCALFTAGGGQVHEIDAGDKQDDPGDQGKQPYIDDAAAFLVAVGEAVAEVPVIHGKEEGDGGVVALQFLRDEAADLLVYLGYVGG